MLNPTLIVRCCKCGDKILTRSGFFWVVIDVDVEKRELILNGVTSQRFNLDCPYCNSRGTILAGPALGFKPSMIRR